MAEMNNLKSLVTHNWFIKLLSLILAAMLWFAIASESSSEIGIEVPLEYRNIPPELEVAGQTTNMVQVRLRGSSNMIKEVSPQQVTTTIDLRGSTPGDKTFPLTPQNVSAPFGLGVVLVNPSRVRVTLERTISRALPVTAVLDGTPASGFEVKEVRISPETVEVHGPESIVASMASMPTVPLRVEGEKSDLREVVDLDPGESMLRLTNASPVEVQVLIRPKQ
jgi:YbbR domain-containing protein